MTEEMSLNTGNSSAFVTPAGEGLALWHLDSLIELKAVSAATGGQLTVFEQRLPGGSSAPLHVHDREDEAWFVLDGALQFVVGDQWLEARTGAFLWAPRAIPHTFRVESEGARLLGITVPAGFEEFFVATGRPAPERVLPPVDGPPDVAAMAEGAARFGCTIVGPPLAPH